MFRGGGVMFLVDWPMDVCFHRLFRICPKRFDLKSPCSSHPFPCIWKFAWVRMQRDWITSKLHAETTWYGKYSCHFAIFFLKGWKVIINGQRWIQGNAGSVWGTLKFVASFIGKGETLNHASTKPLFNSPLTMAVFTLTFLTLLAKLVWKCLWRPTFNRPIQD